MTVFTKNISNDNNISVISTRMILIMLRGIGVVRTERQCHGNLEVQTSGKALRRNETTLR